MLEGFVVGGELAVCGAEVVPQFDGIYSGEVLSCRQPEHRRLVDMPAADCAKRAPDVGRTG